MSNEHPNIEVLKRFDPRNPAVSMEVIADDAVFHFINPKLPQIQGDYVGPKGFAEFFGKLGALSKGSFKVTPVTSIPMGDELVVSHIVDSMVIHGRQMEADAVIVWRILDGKIREAWDIPAMNTARIAEPAN